MALLHFPRIEVSERARAPAGGWARCESICQRSNNSSIIPILSNPIHYYYFPPIPPLRASLSSFASIISIVVSPVFHLCIQCCIPSLLHYFGIFFFSAFPNPQSRLSPGLDVSVFWGEKKRSQSKSISRHKLARATLHTFSSGRDFRP